MKRNSNVICTDLIPREELKFECRSAGREVETQCKKKYKACGRKMRSLSTKEIDNIFEPLIDHIEEKTKIAVSRERDEMEGQIADQKKQDEKEDIINKRRAELSETLGKLVINSSDDSHTRTFYLINTDTEFIKGLQEAFDEKWEMITSWEEEYSRLDEIDDETIYRHKEDDDFYQKYLQEIEVTLKAPYSQLIGLDHEGLFEFIRNYKPSRSELDSIMKNLNKYRLLKYYFELDIIFNTYECMLEVLSIETK